MKIAHKILYTVAILVAGIILIWFIIGILNINSIYGKKMFIYQQNKICIECFNGTRSGICPQLSNHYGDNKLVYPHAVESREMMDRIPNDGSNYSESHVIRNGYCGKNHSALTTERQNFIERFQVESLPKKSLSEGLELSANYIASFPADVVLFFYVRFGNVVDYFNY